MTFAHGLRLLPYRLYVSPHSFGRGIGKTWRKVNLICTRQLVGYRQLSKAYPLGSSTNAKGQHIVGAIHTNTIEGFWSIFKCGVVGIPQSQRKYMPLHVAEFQFRYNNRNEADIFGRAIAGCSQECGGG